MPFSTCSGLGVATMTPSGRFVANRSVRLGKIGTPTSLAKSAASGAGSTIADSLQEPLFWMSRTWWRPIRPAPATAIQTSLITSSLQSQLQLIASLDPQTDVSQHLVNRRIEHRSSIFGREHQVVKDRKSV